MNGAIPTVKQRKSEVTNYLKSYVDVLEDEAAKSYESLVSHMPDNTLGKLIEDYGIAAEVAP